MHIGDLQDLIGDMTSHLVESEVLRCVAVMPNMSLCSSQDRTEGLSLGGHMTGSDQGAEKQERWLQSQWMSTLAIVSVSSILATEAVTAGRQTPIEWIRLISIAFLAAYGLGIVSHSFRLLRKIEGNTRRPG